MTLAATSPAAHAGPPGARRLSPPRSIRRTVLQFVSVCFVAASVWSIYDIGVNPLTLFLERDDIFNLLERMWYPRIEHPMSVLDKVLDTFFMAFVGTFIGCVLALPIGFLAASNVVPSRIVRSVARAIIVATRAVPDLVMALIFVRVFGIGVLAGVLALGIHSVGMIGKLFADSIEQIDGGPRDGVLATGAGRFQVLASGVVPQVVPSFIAIGLYRLDINFRSATLLGIVGAGGIGLDIRSHQGSLDYPQLLGVTLVIIAVIVVVELASTQIRTIILGHSRSATGLLSKLRTSPTAADFRVAGDAATESTTQAVRRLTPPWTRERVSMYVFASTCVALLTLSFIVTDMSLGDLLTGLPELPGLFWRLVPDNMDWWQSQFLGQFVETIAMGFAATFIALLFAIPTGFMAARNVAPARWVYGVSRAFILGMRALPDLVIAVIFVAALGLGPKPGVLALSIGLYGFASKLFADAIEEVGDGPRDGVRATGASGVQESFTGVLSQALPSIVGNSLYLLDVAIRSSTVLGIVGAGGIGFTLFQGSKLLKWDLIGGILIITFVIVYSIELLSTWVRKQIL